MDPVSVEGPCDRLDGEIAYVQVEPSCVTVNVCPPIVRRPVRELVLVFVETEYVTVPLPFPLAPEVMVSHVTLLEVVQLQPELEVTCTVPVSDALGCVRLCGEIVYAHVVPDCFTVNVSPATLIVPVRSPVVMLLETE